MLTEYAKIKKILLRELWLPVVIQAGEFLYPRRNNKNLKVLTLTHSSNCLETVEFIKNKLTKKEMIFGWAKGSFEKIRLDLEKIGTVIGPYNFEDSIISNCDHIKDKFPFDLINLDFVSQSPEFEDGRIEKEIFCLEHSLKLQYDKRKGKFALLYTSIINSSTLNLDEIKNNSDTIVISLLGQIDLSGLPNHTNDQNQKIECLKNIIKQICSKYDFNVAQGLSIMNFDMADTSKKVISISFLLERS